MTIRERLTAIWPQFGLRIVGDGIELRVPDDGDLVDLAEVAIGGIHASDFMPFNVPWTRGTPEEVRRGILAHGWTQRSKLAPNEWSLPFVVVAGGAVAGVQHIRADRFPARRTVATGSWLGLGFQGKGLGTAMRAAVLQLAFEGLDAVDAESASRIGNLASARVSAKLGYRADGVIVNALDNERVVLDRWRISRETWLDRVPSRSRFEITGLEPCRQLLTGGE